MWQDADLTAQQGQMAGGAFKFRGAELQGSRSSQRLPREGEIWAALTPSSSLEAHGTIAAAAARQRLREARATRRHEWKMRNSSAASNASFPSDDTSCCAEEAWPDPPQLPIPPSFPSPYPQEERDRRDSILPHRGRGEIK